MKKIFTNIGATGLIVSVLTVAFSLIGPSTALAATAPSLGIADPYAIFGKASVANTGAPTHIWGNVGADLLSNITGLIGSQVDGTIAGPVAGVQTAATAAYGALDAQGADGGQTLSGTVVITPGVWTVGAALMNGTVTLNGAGVYIFRSSSNITVSPGAQLILTNGATACNVFWEVANSMTIDVGAHIEGTIIANSSLISLNTNASLVGRAFSLVSQVTLASNQVTNPCAAATPPPSSNQPATINVVKIVINDNGGTMGVANFPLFVNGIPVVSGQTNTFPAPASVYTVTETSNPNYTRTFSGDCDVNGQLNLNPGNNRFCIVTNNDIGAPPIPPVPPIIDVVKVPSPLSLPLGPGPVTYTYTLRNIGTVPVSNITMVGDSCSPIVRQSGDTNGDNKLDVTETWVYTCSTTLNATHTNTVVATGTANGITATDIASATVIVGIPLDPPLIHVTKVPSPFTLPAGGGMVTYTKTVTNPGTVPLSNVRLIDDTCSPVVYRSGDANGDGMLQHSESWIFTCSTRLTKTTINTVIAAGDGNGLTARDFALATVTVATPTLPSAGYGPSQNIPLWQIMAGLFLGLSILFYASRREQTV